MKEVITYDKDGVKLVETIYEGEEQVASDETKATRLNVCSSCPFKNDDICNSCGCLLVVITSLTDSVCPEGKW